MLKKIQSGLPRVPVQARLSAGTAAEPWRTARKHRSSSRRPGCPTPCLTPFASLPSGDGGHSHRWPGVQPELTAPHAALRAAADALTGEALTLPQDPDPGRGRSPCAHPAVTGALAQGWKTDRFLVPFRPGALFSVASYPHPGLCPQGRRIRGFEGARAPPEHENAPSHCQKHPFKMKGKLHETPFQTDIQQSYDGIDVHFRLMSV